MVEQQPATIKIDKTKPQPAWLIQSWRGEGSLDNSIPDESGYYLEYAKAEEAFEKLKENPRVLSEAIFKTTVEWDPNIIHEPGYGNIDYGSWSHAPDIDWDEVKYWIRPGYEPKASTRLLEKAPAIIAQYPWGDVPKKIDLPPEVPIPPYKGGAGNIMPMLQERLDEWSKKYNIPHIGIRTHTVKTHTVAYEARKHEIWIHQDLLETTQREQRLFIAVVATFAHEFGHAMQRQRLGRTEYWRRMKAKGAEMLELENEADQVMKTLTGWTRERVYNMYKTFWKNPIMNKVQKEHWAKEKPPAKPGTIGGLMPATEDEEMLGPSMFEPEESPAEFIKQERAKVEMPSVPTKITMEEYNASWKPKGWNIIFIGPTKTWRSEWGVWEAIREIVQNALDEAEEYTYGFDETGFWIKDSGRGIGVRDFLLGPPKLKEDWARGKYGEGMKIGGLALVRSGYPVYVEAGDREVIILFLEQDVQGKVDTLAALWRTGRRKMGTTWHIFNYHGDDFAERFAVNLPKSAIRALVPSKVYKPKQRYNALIEYNFTGDPAKTWRDAGYSRVFARDIYMRDISSPFSYNLWGFDLAPDRHAPSSENDMWTDIGRVWAAVKDQTMLETFLKMTQDPPEIECDETHNLQLSYLGTLPEGKSYASIIEDNKEVWAKAWNNVVGSDSVIRTNAKWDGTVKHLGYKSVSMGYGSREALKNVIKSDQTLIDESQDKLRDVAVMPDNKLTPRQLASLNLARKVIELSSNVWNVVRGVHAGIIPPASDRVRTAGLYSRTTQEIFIATDQLEYGHTAVDVSIHELAHHTSQAEDAEKAHYDEISRLAGIVVSYAAKNRFDEQIAAPDFHW